MKLANILQARLRQGQCTNAMDPIDSNDCLINDPDMESISKVVSLHNFALNGNETESTAHVTNNSNSGITATFFRTSFTTIF